MSRIRSIKPEFWSSAQILECSRDARLLFIGLWNFCDDLGRHSFSPKQIKAEVFPGDDLLSENIQGMLDELSANGLIDVYCIENKEILQVCGWHHQKIDHPQKAKLPGPPLGHSPSDRRTFSPESIGKDRIGRDRSRVESTRESANIRGTFDEKAPEAPENNNKKFKKISKDAEPTVSQTQAAIEKGLSEVERQAEWTKFRDYNLAKGSALADWDAAWRVWLGHRKTHAKSNGEARRPPPKMPGQDRLRTSSGLWVDGSFYPTEVS